MQSPLENRPEIRQVFDEILKKEQLNEEVKNRLLSELMKALEDAGMIPPIREQPTPTQKSAKDKADSGDKCNGGPREH